MFGIETIFVFVDIQLSLQIINTNHGGQMWGNGGGHGGPGPGPWGNGGHPGPGGGQAGWPSEAAVQAMPHNTVDWAALAQQWIAMRGDNSSHAPGPPPPPAPSFQPLVRHPSPSVTHNTYHQQYQQPPRPPPPMIPQPRYEAPSVPGEYWADKEGG